MLYAQYRYWQSLKEEQARILAALPQKPGSRVMKREIHGKTYYYYNTQENGKRCQKIAGEKEYQNYRRYVFLKKHLDAVKEELCRLEKSIKNIWMDLQKEFATIQALPPQQQGKQSFRPEELIYKTLRGEKVRSKSEIIIADALYRHGIDYVYEKPLDADNRIHVDFTIENNLHGIPIYWEHFGIMNRPEYVRAYLEKKEYYESLDIIENRNLIATFEFYDSAGHSIIPFDSRKADRIIFNWFMPPQGGSGRC